MMYTHERAERKADPAVFSTEFPTRSVAAGDRIAAHNYLAARNLRTNLAFDNGWYVSREAGLFRELRLVIPAVSQVSGHCYWQARSLHPNTELRYTSAKGARRGAIVVVRPMRSKGSVIVEGPADSLAVASSGYTGYALMGTNPGMEAASHLMSLLPHEEPVLVLLDRDSKQEGAALSLLLASHGFRAINGLLPGPEKDLAECLPSKRVKVLDRLYPSSSNVSR